jgi:hypothetical protein
MSDVVRRRVLLQEEDYMNLIGPYSKLTDIKATNFAYHTVRRVTGPAAVMIPANHISNDNNDTRKAVDGCLSDTVVVFEVLGEGSFGAVYSAFDIGLDGLVAVKVLSLSRKLKEEDVQRELFALRGLRKVYGNRLVTVFRIEHTAKHQHVVVMEKMQTSLKKVMQTVEIWQDHDRCQRYMIMLCQAVFAMHRNGWYHRDLKPANIMISADMQMLKLGDFGLTTDNKIAIVYAGSEDYLAPEMLDRKEVVGKDLEKADLWSLGAVLYEMASGQRLKSKGLSCEKLARRMRGLALTQGASSVFVAKCLQTLLRWNPLKRELPDIVDYSEVSFHQAGTELKCAHFPTGVAHGPATPPKGGPNPNIEHLRYKFVLLIMFFGYCLN